MLPLVASVSTHFSVAERGQPPRDSCIYPELSCRVMLLQYQTRFRVSHGKWKPSLLIRCQSDIKYKLDMIMLQNHAKVQDLRERMTNKHPRVSRSDGCVNRFGLVCNVIRF